MVGKYLLNSILWVLPGAGRVLCLPLCAAIPGKSRRGGDALSCHLDLVDVGEARPSSARHQTP